MFTLWCQPVQSWVLPTQLGIFIVVVVVFNSTFYLERLYQIICLSNAIHGTAQILSHLSVCLSVRSTYRSRWRPQFLSDLSQIWNVGHTSDNEEYVRWPVTQEVVNAHAHQFTSGLAHFRLASYTKIALMSNISKTVTDRSIEAAYEIAPGLSIGTMIVDLGWPWTVLVRGHQNYTSNISKMVTYTIMGSVEVKWEVTHGLSIGIMTFDLGWLRTALVRGHKVARQIFQKWWPIRWWESIEVE